MTVFILETKSVIIRVTTALSSQLYFAIKQLRMKLSSFYFKFFIMKIDGFIRCLNALFMRTPHTSFSFYFERNFICSSKCLI